MIPGVSFEGRRRTRAFWSAMDQPSAKSGPAAARIQAAGWPTTIRRADGRSYDGLLRELAETNLKFQASFEIEEGALLRLKILYPALGELLELDVRVGCIELSPAAASAWIVQASPTALSKEQRLRIAKWSFHHSTEEWKRQRSA